ncbi:iron response transcriptional regulator IrrA [Pedomonas mirosovicensis]|uniref:iron response transcriptional regulator IrrA n=1 Tax=Pedomonas mirosovicensis TaxID=2908641 RepID=UPI00216A649A|nr:Fur family transcriptional regulator [Pedomonas mirosovicensis]MCH8684096.1 transcriptional repressor [Pedomonas mirosovicensis]
MGRINTGRSQRIQPQAALVSRLRAAGLRPTQQRIALAALLFQGEQPRHVTAEQLFAGATAAGVPISLATVYNTLRQFTAAGLLQQVVLEAGRCHFDTNVEPHQHVVIVDSTDIRDIDSKEIVFAQLPPPPEGTQIERIDVIIRVRPAA